MKAIEFATQNMMLMPPNGAERGTCGQLPAYHNPSNGSIVSVWKPDAEELKGLAEGAHILLHVYGGAHPPVAMSVQKMEELP